MPLHVFEPRYREMVKHCLSNDVMMGVCHTQKVVHEVKKKQSLQASLNSNQSSYKPHPVFSIGTVELLESLPDGRMHIQVNMLERVKLEKEVQTLPFTLVEVSPLPDMENEKDEQDCGVLKEKIIRRMNALFSDKKALVDFLHSDDIQDMGWQQFSYAIFSVIRFDPEIQQNLLDMRSARQRMEKLLELINT